MGGLLKIWIDRKLTVREPGGHGTVSCDTYGLVLPPVAGIIYFHRIIDELSRPQDLMLHFQTTPGYDGGDCCECTCVDTPYFRCGSNHHGGYACLDPSAPCVDDDDVTILPEFEYTSYSGRSSSLCFVAGISDGDCDPSNNNENCGT